MNVNVSQLESKSEKFGDFCQEMTQFAEGQLDLHRQKYYGVSKRAYGNIMKCYSNARQTNEEADSCAQSVRDKMTSL